MEKWLSWSSLGVAAVLFLLFLLDLVLSLVDVPLQPFGGLSLVVDVLGMLASGLLVWLAWDALRELR